MTYLAMISCFSFIKITTVVTLFCMLLDRLAEDYCKICSVIFRTLVQQARE